MNKLTMTLISTIAMTGLAFAQQKAPAPKAPDQTAPAKVEKPKPPAEIAAFLKQMGPRMSCTGTSVGPDGKSEVKMKATGLSKMALDGWWIHGTSNILMGEGKNIHRLKIESYQTWDPKISKWRTVGVANDGSVMVGTGEMKDGKYESMSDMYGGMMGNGKFRERGEMIDAAKPKAGMKMVGEMSTDGRTWTKVYDMTCK